MSYYFVSINLFVTKKKPFFVLGNLDILLTVRHYTYINHVQIYYIPLISIIYKYLQKFCVPSPPYTQSVKVPHLNVHTLMWFFPTYFLVLSSYKSITCLSLSISFFHLKSFFSVLSVLSEQS